MFEKWHYMSGAKNKSSGRWGKPNVPVPMDVFNWLVAMPTRTLGAAALKFFFGTPLAY